nr:hypothetical protein [Candidatus Sigynarchaeota archaeon]
MNKQDWRFLYSWLTDPGTFFPALFSKLASRGKKVQVPAFVATFAIPVIACMNFAWFFVNNAVATVLERFVPERIAFVVAFALFLIIGLLLGLYYMALPPAKRFRDAGGREVRVKIRRLSTLNIIRNNLCSLPALILSICLAISVPPISWNIIHYGIYLTVMAWLSIAWTGWLAAESARALPAIFTAQFQASGAVVGEFQVKRIVVISIVIFLVECLVADLVLPLLIGGEHLPIFFKIAYFLMHGN